MTEKKKNKTRLSEVPIFAGIPEESLADIQEIIQKQHVPAGDIIFREGDPGDNFYIIDSGMVKVFKLGDEDVETELSLLGPGESFGEMALFTGERRSANISALEETALSVIARSQFEQILKTHPDVSYAFIKQMAEWLAHGEKRLKMEAERQYHAPKLAWSDFLIILVLSIVCAFVFNKTNPNGISLFPKAMLDDSITTISVSQAMVEHEKRNALFVDAMPNYFYDKEHVAGAVNIPLALFDIMYMMALSEEDKEREIIVYGRTISKLYDEEVASKLNLHGHKNVRLLKSSLTALKKKGFPLES
jgi:rhodanese-related sulfurtransferase